ARGREPPGPAPRAPGSDLPRPHPPGHDAQRCPRWSGAGRVGLRGGARVGTRRPPPPLPRGRPVTTSRRFPVPEAERAAAATEASAPPPPVAVAHGGDPAPLDPAFVPEPT